MQEINCRNFESTIQDMMDQRLSIADSKSHRNHAEHCVQCSVILAEFAALEEGLVVLGDSPEFEMLAVSASQKMLAVSASQIKSVEQNLSHGRFGVMGLLASIAAVLLISLSISNLQKAPELFSSNSGERTIGNSPIAIENSRNESEPLAPNAVAAQTFDSEAMQDSWQQLSDGMNKLSPYYRYSAELPGVRPLQTSINLTVNFFQQTFQAQPRHASEDQPDLGMATSLPLFQA